MNYKKRDDELIKLNKQAREKNKSYNIGNNSSDVGYTNKAFESRRKLPVVTNSPNKATTQANAPVKTSEPKKPSTRYSNQTAGDTTPKQSTRDTRFDNDFDNFYEYRYARSDMMDYDPSTENSIPHWQNLKKEIMAKNKWSENEFDSKWNEYNQERNKKEADKEINTMVELGKKNAILGTIGQAAYMPQTMIEGAGAMLSNLMPTKYKAQSADDGSFTGTRVREATKQAVKDAHIKSGAGKTAYDVGTSLADMVIGSGIPVLGAASLGLETAARTNMEALERGTSANKAAATAGIAGLISGAMNKVGLDKAAGAEAKTALGKVLKGAGVEAAENLLEDTANLGVDTLINTDKSQINALHEYYANQGMDDKEAWNKARLDVLADLATSALSGAAFGGVMNGVRNLPSLIPEIRDLTRGLELNNRGGVDTPEISKELNKAIPAPAKVYSFEPMTGEAKANNEALYKDLGKQLKQKNVELDEAYKAYKSIPKGKKNKYQKTEAYKKVEKLRQEAEDIRWQKRNVRAATQGNVALQLSKEDYNQLFDGQKGITNLINLTVKFAGNTEEAQQLGRDANAALKQYVQSGNSDDYFRFTKLAGDLSNIADQVKADYVAKNGTVYKYDDVWGGTVDKEDWYPYENTLKNFVTENTIPNLVKGIHATKSVPEVTTQAGESAPEIPNVVGESAPTNIEPTAEPISEQPVNNVPKLTAEEQAELQNELAEEYDWTDNRVPEVTQPTSDNIPPTNEPPVEPPTVDSMIEPPTEGKDIRRESKVGTNTGVNAKLFTENQIKNDPVLSELNKYIPSSEQESFDNALMNVDKNGDELLNDYITGKKTIDNDRDVDQSMILLTNLTNRLNDGDTSVETQRNLLFSRLRQAGTKYGQTINAFKKWNNTAEGTVANGLGLLGDTTEKWKKSNKKAKVLNGRIAEALKRLGYDGSMERQRAELPREKVREGVVNVIKREYGSVEGLFNNDDIEFLTDMAMDKSIPIWRITDEIEHKLNHGEWYEWYENEEPVYPINQKLKNAFDALIPREKTVKEPPTLDELKHQVEATIEKEMASIDNFDDDDITYLANLINEGATKDELAEALNMKMATGRFGISVDTQRRVSDLFEEANQYDPDSKQAYDLRTEAYKLIANEAVSEDASGFEKYDSWRYLAMLGNPKTWVRNKIGNEINNVVTGVSNNISAALEAGVNYGLEKMGKEGIQRTKAFLNPVDDRGLIKAATEDGDNHRYSELLGSKYERGVKDAIKQQKSVFNSKALRTAEAVVDWGISDYKNVKRKYGTSLAGYMKANGLDENAFKADNRYRELLDKSRSQLLTDAESAEMNSLKPIYDELEKARDYAVKQAEYATFHEDNAFAKWWTQSSNNAPAPIRFLMEGLLPFKKTPANILKSGFQYNPLGAIESIAKTGKLIYENTGKRKGNLEDTYIGKDWKGKDVEINKTLASEVIDSWSKTATGSMLVGLGFYLKNKGILNSSNSDEKYQDQLEGKQNYSITINGHTYTIDWAAPGVMPLLMGAELSKIKDKNLMLNKNWYENMSELVGTVNAILDPMFETSMLSGVKDTMQQAANDLKYDEDAAVGGILGSMAYNAATGYITQGLPTLSGQIARTVDNTRRSTDTVNEGPLGVLERQTRKMMNKIPGLSRLNQPYYDSYGRTQNNGPKNPLLNLAYQLGSPGYLQKINTTPADEAARNTYYALSEPNEEGERLPIMNKDVFPSWKSKVTVNGEKYTPEQMATYRKTSGEAQYAIRDALAKEDWFNNLSGEKQTDLLKKVNNLVDKIGKDANGDGSDNKELGIYQSDGVPGLLNYWHGTDEYQKWIDDTGIGTGTNAAKEVKALMLEGNFDEANEVAQKAKTDNEARVKYNEENGTNIGLADWQKKYSDTTPTTSTQSTTTPTTTTPKASTTTRPTVTETKQPSPRPHPIGSNATSNNASSTANVDMSDYDKQIARAGKQSKKFENDLPVLVGMGAKEPETYTYAYAINQDPSLTAKTYHDTYTKLNYDGANAVSQQDMIDYFNANNLNEQQGMYYWTTYGEKGGQPWKKLPRLTNGTWKK